VGFVFEYPWNKAYIDEHIGTLYLRPQFTFQALKDSQSQMASSDSASGT
jgi:hypothetical protein